MNNQQRSTVTFRSTDVVGARYRPQRSIISKNLPVERPKTSAMVKGARRFIPSRPVRQRQQVDTPQPIPARAIPVARYRRQNEWYDDAANGKANQNNQEESGPVILVHGEMQNPNGQFGEPQSYPSHYPQYGKTDVQPEIHVPVVQYRSNDAIKSVAADQGDSQVVEDFEVADSAL